MMTVTNACTLVSEPNREMAQISVRAAAGNGALDEIGLNVSRRFTAAWLSGAIVCEQDAPKMQDRAASISETVDQEIERLELAIRQGSTNALPDHGCRIDSAMPSLANEKVFHNGTGEDAEFLDLGSRLQTNDTRPPAHVASSVRPRLVAEVSSDDKRANARLETSNHEIERLELAIRQGSANA